MLKDFAGSGTTTVTSLAFAISRNSSTLPVDVTTFRKGPVKSPSAFAIVANLDADRVDARSRALALWWVVRDGGKTNEFTLVKWAISCAVRNGR